VRATTINSYLYTEYADDDDLQAFVSAYNAATQTFITWFNKVALPYYPGLSGPLLDWVGSGLYGQPRTSLASPASTALGMLNTVPLNTLVLNGYVPSTSSVYVLPDDIYQRILTWNFYKGDGKRFCTRWFKRRIARFLFGANGIDPQPFLPGFTPNPNFQVGCETTTAIGMHISGSVITVTINQTLLSTQATISPLVLTLFALALEAGPISGPLDLPIQYTYVVDIVTALTATAIPGILSSSSPNFSQTTASTSVATSGGTGLYTYAWTWLIGGSGITITSPSSANTTFSASGLTWGTTLTGFALCTVTDTVSSLTTTITCLVTIACVMPPMILTEGGSPILTEGGTPIIEEP
jgi:hypothetical protein